MGGAELAAIQLGAEGRIIVNDVFRFILDYNAGRDPDRRAMKFRKMRANSFLFLRGTCHPSYDRLPAKRVFEQAPKTWVYGDLHLENFGSP